SAPPVPPPPCARLPGRPSPLSTVQAAIRRSACLDEAAALPPRLAARHSSKYRSAGSDLPTRAGVRLRLSAVRAPAFQRHAATLRVAGSALAIPVPAPAIVLVAAPLLRRIPSARHSGLLSEALLVDVAASPPLHWPAHR